MEGMNQRLYSDTSANFHTAEEIRNMNLPSVKSRNSRLNMVSHRIIKTLVHSFHRDHATLRFKASAEEGEI